MTKENEIKVGDKYILKTIFRETDLPIDAIVIAVLMGAYESIIEIRDVKSATTTMLFYKYKFELFYNKVED